MWHQTNLSKITILLILGFYFVSGFILFYYPQSFVQIGLLCYLASIGCLIKIIQLIRYDFIIQLRFTFVLAIGLAAGATKLFEPELFLTNFGKPVQTFNVMVRIYALTLIAVGSCLIGYLLSLHSTKSKSKKLIINVSMARDFNLYWITLIFIVIVGYYSGKSYGPPIWEAAYASGHGDGQLLGNLQSIGVILIGINYLITYKLNNTMFRYLSFATYFYFLVFNILIRGGRLEFLSGVLAIFVCRQLFIGISPNMRIRSYVLLVFAAFSLEYFGYIRHTLITVGNETYVEGLLRMIQDGVLSLGTISGIGSNFANIIHMLDTDVITHSYGLNYLDYILRIPPAFLYPNRPEDLSSIFQLYNYVSIGGFFEVGEEYMSFGILGVVVIPGCITFFLRLICNRGLNGSFFYYVLTLSIISVFMRGAWYQTFAYFKAGITGIIIYWLAEIIHKFYHRNIKTYTLSNKS